MPVQSANRRHRTSPSIRFAGPLTGRSRGYRQNLRNMRFCAANTCRSCVAVGWNIRLYLPCIRITFYRFSGNRSCVRYTMSDNGDFAIVFTDCTHILPRKTLHTGGERSCIYRNSTKENSSMSNAEKVSALIAEIEAAAYARGQADARKEILDILGVETSQAAPARKARGRPRKNVEAPKRRASGRKRAPKGSVPRFVERALHDRPGQSPQEILARASTDMERLIKLASIRTELRNGQNQGKYRSEEGRWYHAGTGSAAAAAPAAEASPATEPGPVAEPAPAVGYTGMATPSPDAS